MMNPMSMMKNLNQMQQKIQSLQAEMESALFKGQAAGGLVSVTMTGKYECQQVQIDPSLLDDKDTLEDALRVAINDATSSASTTLTTKMTAITGGMKIPGIN